MPQEKKIIGKDTLYSVLGRFLHSLAHVATRYSSMNKTKRCNRFKAVRLEENTVADKVYTYLIINLDKFTDNEGWFVDMYCARQYCNIDVKGILQ
jgi:hypothetical protein